MLSLSLYRGNKVTHLSSDVIQSKTLHLWGFRQIPCLKRLPQKGTPLPGLRCIICPVVDNKTLDAPKIRLLNSSQQCPLFQSKAPYSCLDIQDSVLPSLKNATRLTSCDHRDSGIILCVCLCVMKFIWRIWSGDIDSIIVQGPPDEDGLWLVLGGDLLISLDSKRATYTVWRPLSRDVLFWFRSEVPLTHLAAQYLQYQPNGRWNMSNMLYKISRPSRHHTL